MKKINLWLLASLFVGVFALTSCSSSDSDGDGGTTTIVIKGKIEAGTPVTPTDMKMSALSGFVKDKDGKAISGVTVISGTEKCTTGGDGGFVFERVNVVNGRTVVKFEKSGYVDVVRSLEQGNAVWEVVMAEEGYGDNYASRYENSAASFNLSTTSGMNTVFEQNGFKDAATGVAYSGYVSTSMNYLDPDDDKFAEMMPGGDLAAVRNGQNGGTNGEQVQLISYGMTKVEMKGNNGEKLQLAEGKPATLTFPVPDKFKNDKPSTIPLWSFNESTGLWEEEGIATYDASNDVYVGTVTHFSWVNLDYPEKRATLKVTVKNDKGVVVPNVKVDVDGQRSVFTATNGVAELYVPVNTALYVTVHSADYGNYVGEVKKDVSPITSAGETKEVEIVLPSLPSISGKVTNTGVGGNITTLWVEYDGKETTKVHSDKDGQFYMLAPEYNGAAVLKVRAIDGTTYSYDITLDGKDQAFNISVAATAETGGKATFTMKDKSATYEFAVPNVSYESLSGVTIIDDALSYSASAGDNDNGRYSASLNIDEGYSDSKKDYSNAYFSFNQGAGNNWLYGSTYRTDGVPSASKVTITKTSDGNYRFQLSGEGMVTGTGMQGGNQANATVSADFTSPLLMRAKSLSKVTNKDASFPSFTPWISGLSATAGMQITESEKLGKGVALMFFNTATKTLGYSDYLEFKNQARKALGDPVQCYDLGDDPTKVDEGNMWDICTATFYKGGKYILVSYCPWRSDIEEDMGNHGELEHMSKMGMYVLFETHMARIHVNVLEGLNIGYDFLMGLGPQR